MSGSYPPPPPGQPGGWPTIDEPTIPPPPAGGFPPVGPPPAGPPPAPPGGFPPGGGMPPGGLPPHRKRRWPMLVAIAAVLVLVIGIGVSSFLYFTGRLGFGPLSAKDEAAISALADGVATPAWVAEGDLECAAEEWVRDDRSEAIAATGVLAADGEAWEYVAARWRERDANGFVSYLFGCNGDWPERVAEEWQLEDASCLGDIDEETMADYFAADFLLGLPDEDGKVDTDAEEARADLKADGIAALDECYVADPEAAEVTTKRAYRAVKFTVAAAEDAEVSIRTDGSWQPLRGTTHEVDTGEGGAEGCLEVRVETTYAWGSTAEAQTRACAKAKPKRVWWKKLDGCQSEGQSNCTSYRLRFAGYSDYDVVSVEYRHNGGDCLATSGGCTSVVLIGDDGRESAVQQWSFPAGYSGRFVAVIDDDREVVLPN